MKRIKMKYVISSVCIILLIVLGSHLGEVLQTHGATKIQEDKRHRQPLERMPISDQQLSNTRNKQKPTEPFNKGKHKQDIKQKSQNYRPQHKENDEGQYLQNSEMRKESSISIDEANAIEEKLTGNKATTSLEGNYKVVDTGMDMYYSNTTTINKPSKGEDYYGQDANYSTHAFNYTDNGNGTISDNVTGLMWQQNPGEKMTWEEAVHKLEDFTLAGHTDWRLPTIKELYSLINFSGETGTIPYIDDTLFKFKFGDETGERMIDSQYATSTIYESDTMNGNTTVFGVNFADGRIKGYPIDKEFYVMFVRGNEAYGLNNFVDNGDGTITDLSTGLMWMTYDSGYFVDEGAMDWDDALAWCENLDYAGYDDWKLPDAKELQSIVDYTKSKDTTDSAAINPLFYTTSVKAIDGSMDYPFYWTSTTHLDGRYYGENAVYIAFGEAHGEMNGTLMDVHGAGAQRSDPKTGDASLYPQAGNGPQGDVRNVFNYVRAVRIVTE